MEIVILLIVGYLAAGLFFNTKGFSWYNRILLHLVWLPAVIGIWFVAKKGNLKIM